VEQSQIVERSLENIVPHVMEGDAKRATLPLPRTYTDDNEAYFARLPTDPWGFRVTDVRAPNNAARIRLLATYNKRGVYECDLFYGTTQALGGESKEVQRLFQVHVCPTRPDFAKQKPKMLLCVADTVSASLENVSATGESWDVPSDTGMRLVPTNINESGGVTDTGSTLSIASSSQDPVLVYNVLERAEIDSDFKTVSVSRFPRNGGGNRTVLTMCNTRIIHHSAGDETTEQQEVFVYEMQLWSSGRRSTTYAIVLWHLQHGEHAPRITYLKKEPTESMWRTGTPDPLSSPSASSTESFVLEKDDNVERVTTLIGGTRQIGNDAPPIRTLEALIVETRGS
jgi:hypothetical protein